MSLNMNSTIGDNGTPFVSDVSLENAIAQCKRKLKLHNTYRKLKQKQCKQILIVDRKFSVMLFLIKAPPKLVVSNAVNYLENVIYSKINCFGKYHCSS